MARSLVSFLRHALSGVLRSGKRTLASILGVTLAIVLVSGTFIAVDSATSATLDAMLLGIPGDFTTNSPPSNHGGNVSAFRAALMSVSGVIGVSIYRPLAASFVSVGTASGPYAGSVSAYGIEPGHLPSFLRGVQVNGSLELPRGSIALSTTLASHLRLRMGDVFYLASQEWDSTINATRTYRLNFTVGALLATPADGFPVVFCGRFCASPTSLAVVNLADMDWVEENLGLTHRSYVGEYAQVWIDRARFLDPYDLAGTKRNLLRLDRQLLAAYPLALGVADNLSPVLDTFAQNTSMQRLVFLLLSTPVLLLGLYLGAAGVDLAHGERRREVAILRTRGSSDRQIVALLVVEASLGGIIAAGLGLLVGVLLSRVLLNIVNPLADPSILGSAAFALSPGTVVVIILLSVLLMAAASYRSARRTARLPIAETLHYYAPGETQIRYRPAIDAALVIAGSAIFAFAWLTEAQPGSIITFLFGGAFFALIPAAPLLLIFGATRLATRSTGRVYDWASRVVQPFAKSLHHVIRRNLSRNPRRSANVAVIVALGLGFGLFAFGLMGSNQAYQVRSAHAVVGADAAILGVPGSLGFERNLSALPEVAEVTRFSSVFGTTYGQPVVFALDPDSFFNVTRPEPWYFEGLNPADAKRILSTVGGLLITDRYYKEASLELGQIIGVTLSWYNSSSSQTESARVEGTIQGIVRTLPGMSNGRPEAPVAVYGSLATFRPIIENETRQRYGPIDNYLVDLRPEADWHIAKADMEGLANADPLRVQDANVLVFEEMAEEENASPLTQAFLGFIRTEVVFMAVILTTGLGTILYAASLERKPEFAAMSARGASRRQIAGLLVGEAVSIVLIGVAVGAGIGLVASYLGMAFFLVGPPGTPATLVPFFFVMPTAGWLLVVLAPIAMLVESLFLGWRIAEMDVARVLKIRGG